MMLRCDATCAKERTTFHEPIQVGPHRPHTGQPLLPLIVLPRISLRMLLFRPLGLFD